MCDNWKGVKGSPSTPWRRRGSRGMSPLILNVGNRWRCVVNFLHQLNYQPVRTPVHIEQTAGWVQRRSGNFWNIEKSLSLEIETRTVRSVTQSPSWILYISWFQTFAVFWMLCAFFWVIPRRLNFIFRCFGTLCLSHHHRQVGVKND